MEVSVIVKITCGFLIATCIPALIIYGLMLKDFIEDYKEDKENEESEI